MEGVNNLTSMLRVYESLGLDRIAVKGRMFGMSVECPIRIIDYRMIGDDVILLLQPGYRFMAFGNSLSHVKTKLKREFKKHLDANPGLKVHLCDNRFCACDDPDINPLPIEKDQMFIFLTHCMMRINN